MCQATNPIKHTQRQSNDCRKRLMASADVLCSLAPTRDSVRFSAFIWVSHPTSMWFIRKQYTVIFACVCPCVCVCGFFSGQISIRLFTHNAPMKPAFFWDVAPRRPVDTDQKTFQRSLLLASPVRRVCRKRGSWGRYTSTFDKAEPCQTNSRP